MSDDTIAEADCVLCRHLDPAQRVATCCMVDIRAMTDWAGPCSALASGDPIPANTEQSGPWRRPGSRRQCQEVIAPAADVDMSQPAAVICSQTTFGSRPP
jgi:hypothetical protein